MSGQCLALFSGKGGVGRTLLTAAFGAHLASEGKRVALVDLNTGMRGLDMALGVESRVAFDLGDVLDGLCSARQALVKAPGEMRLLAARQVRDSETLDEEGLRHVVDELRETFDWVLLDTAGGIGRGFSAAAACGSQAVAVTTPDDAAIRCVERAAGLWQRLDGQAPLLLVNRICARWVREGLQYAPQTCAQVLDMPLCGVVPEDEQAMRAWLSKKPLLGESPAAMGVKNALERMKNPAAKLWDWEAAQPQAETEKERKPFWKKRRGR